MFFQIIRQSLVYSLLNGTLYLAVTELGLGLSLKLRFSYLDGDNGSKALAEVFWCNLYLCLLNLLRDGWVSFCVSLQGAGQRHTETSQVGTTLNGVDVIDV